MEPLFVEHADRRRWSRRPSARRRLSPRTARAISRPIAAEPVVSTHLLPLDGHCRSVDFICILICMSDSLPLNVSHLNRFDRLVTGRFVLQTNSSYVKSRFRNIRPQTNEQNKIQKKFSRDAREKLAEPINNVSSTQTNAQHKYFDNSRKMKKKID